jgi:hypothetical protein
MPARIDIHENEFLEEIWQEGRQEDLMRITREVLLGLLEETFRPIPVMARQRIESADLRALQLWRRRAIKVATLDDLYAKPAGCTLADRRTTGLSPRHRRYAHAR